MKSGYVYCLRFRSTQFYIGSSNNPERRLEEHKDKCFRQKPVNKFMSNVWKKYGEPELYILSKVPVELLQQEEQKFIDLVFGKEGCLNLNPHAYRPPSMKGKKRSAETREKISIAGKGRTPHNKGKKGPSPSAKTRAKMSASRKGIPRTEEEKAKVSATLKGHSVSEETKAKISASLKNRRKEE